MNLSRRSNKQLAGSGRSLWPVMLLLLLIVLVPTVCVLWLMNEAMENERLAVRQQLADAYRLQLTAASEHLDRYWQEKRSDIEHVVETETPATAFAVCVNFQLAHAIVCFDNGGAMEYPRLATSVESSSVEVDVPWLLARRLEYEANDPAEAAKAYAEIAARPQLSDERAALAIKAQARCLLKAGQQDEAVALLLDELGKPRFSTAFDPQGRLIVADAELLAIQVLPSLESPEATAAVKRLSNRLRDYKNCEMPSAQRRFLMKQLREVAPNAVDDALLAAEELAANYLEADVRPPTSKAIEPTALPDIWQLTISENRCVALYRDVSVMSQCEEVIAQLELPPGVKLKLSRNDEVETVADPLITARAGETFPQFQLVMTLTDENPSLSATGKLASYLWIAVLVIGATSILALLVARTVGRRWREAALKNDLVATVSHELKTPLAATRLLVDTLLDGGELGEQQREYLELIAKENRRLTHLIDSFLTFSRMERNKQRFEFESVEPAEIATRAVEVMGDRLHAETCSFDLNIDEDLPSLHGDRDALITVLVNLIENAWKYSGDDKQIGLRVFANAGEICFQVQDNGIGLSAKDQQRAFQRFFQADRTLTGHKQGCGLGLSIVKHIVDAHDGRVEVESRLGQGSAFTVAMPADEGVPSNVAARESCETTPC